MNQRRAPPAPRARPSRRRPDPLRLRLDLQYDGGAFHGWAVQPGLRTVADTLTEALARVLRVEAADLAVVVAGRTDAGVHALGQVCHVDLPRGVDPPAPDVLVRRLRGVLPADVRVTSVGSAPPGFDARFSALRREYRYLLSDEPSGVSPLRRHEAVAHSRPLAVARMTQASRPLLGLHDFAAFCRRRTSPSGESSTVRALEELSWARDADGTVRARVVADAFCHSMVRALVGCLVTVGDGRRPPDWPAAVLAARRRDPAVTVAPAHGLALVAVAYPPDEELAARAAAARAVRRIPGQDDAGDD
ncbi:MAG: tRNA pseudouridine(38-40) synthase TruA [Kineosporiaceae bacterium]